MTEPVGPGEVLERRQKARQTLVVSLLMIAGGITGLTIALTQEHGASLYLGAIPAGVAIGLAALWLVSVLGGSLWLKLYLDEIEQAAQLWGIAVAGTVVVVLYPVWYLLWRGQLATEPNAHILFGILYVVMIAGYLWKKFR